jgi:cytochrome c oxidase cbb3-type subunit III
MAEQLPDPVHDDLTDHEYDGIREYDNPTPSWWHAIFLGSMIFAVFYVFMVHLSPLTRTRHDRLIAVQTRALDRQFGELRTLELGEAKVAKILEREEWISMGSAVFEERCVLCHDAGGRGKAGLGVNLTDNVYKNINSVAGIIGVLQDGIGVAMPSQRANLNDTEMALVTAYVVWLRNTNHPEGIPPEGFEIPEFFATSGD